MEQQNNAAKFAFFYMLSLVALIFMALSSGIIIFQIINKNIVDAIDIYKGQYSSGALKFAISAIIIAGPLYYFAVSRINKNLFSGALKSDSGIRKWLTYFILFISSVVMAGWVVATIYNFLDGELTTKFILKAITAIAISASIFYYYFYDIKRDDVVGKKDKVVMIYFYASLVFVVATLVSGFVFVESPTETRNLKHDQGVVNKLSQIDSAVNEYYYEKKKMPENMQEIRGAVVYLGDKEVRDESTGQEFVYEKMSENRYKLCATFFTASKDYENNMEYGYYDKRWEHGAGYQCLEQKIQERVDMVKPVPVEGF